MLDAAIEVFGRGIYKATFVDLVNESGVPRATAYRLFPEGLESVWDALWGEVLEAARAEIRSAISEALSDGCEVRYEEVVLVGASGAVAGLCSARFAAVLHPQGELMSWLHRRSRPNSMAIVLANYAKGCARRARPTMSRQELAAVEAGAGKLAKTLLTFVFEHEEVIGKVVSARGADRRKTMDELLAEFNKDEQLLRRVDTFVADARLDGVVVAAPPAGTFASRSMVDDAAADIAGAFVGEAA